MHLVVHFDWKERRPETWLYINSHVGTNGSQLDGQRLLQSLVKRYVDRSLQSGKIFVSRVNAQRRVTSENKILGITHTVGYFRVTHSVDTSQPLSPVTPVFAQ